MQWIYRLLCVSRPAHDISLEEFDDEDLSEITDDCGIGLNYDSDPYEKVRPSFAVMLFLLLNLTFPCTFCSFCLKEMKTLTYSVSYVVNFQFCIPV